MKFIKKYLHIIVLVISFAIFIIVLLKFIKNKGNSSSEKNTYQHSPMKKRQPQDHEYAQKPVIHSMNI